MLLTEIIETKNYNFCKNVELESLSLTELEVLCAYRKLQISVLIPVSVRNSYSEDDDKLSEVTIQNTGPTY